MSFRGLRRRVCMRCPQANPPTASSALLVPRASLCVAHGADAADVGSGGCWAPATHVAKLGWLMCHLPCTGVCVDVHHQLRARATAAGGHPAARRFHPLLLRRQHRQGLPLRELRNGMSIEQRTQSPHPPLQGWPDGRPTPLACQQQSASQSDFSPQVICTACMSAKEKPTSPEQHLAAGHRRAERAAADRHRGPATAAAGRQRRDSRRHGGHRGVGLHGQLAAGAGGDVRLHAGLQVCENSSGKER